MASRRRWPTAILCLVAALSVGAAPLAACDPVWLPMARPDRISVFVALALADTVLDTAIAAVKGRMHPAFQARLDTVIGTTPGGQRVRLPGWEDPAGTAEGVLVPWAYGPDCRPIAWSGQLGWIPTGTQGAVTGWLRPRAGWIGGVPTFDVEMAWREPVWASDDPRWFEHAPDERRMTPEQFVELYAALPTFELVERDARAAADRMRRWEEAHRSLAVLAPAPTMLSYMYRRAEEE
jgi:hypothetical protein